jgi:hypothetical protein
MGRLVEAAQIRRTSVTRSGTPESAGGASEEIKVPVGGDGFIDRVTKYVPSEVLAAYLALDRNLIPSTNDYRSKLGLLKQRAAEASVQAGQSVAGNIGNATDLSIPPHVEFAIHSHLPTVLIVIGLFFTPIYIWQLGRQSPGTPWRLHAILATLAFLVWAYAMQGSVFTVGPLGYIFQGQIAAALIVIFSLASGACAPKPRDQTSDASSAAEHPHHESETNSARSLAARGIGNL